MMNDEEKASIIEAVYRAARDPREWGTALAMIRGALHASAIALIGAGARCGSPVPLHEGLPEECLTSHQKFFQLKYYALLSSKHKGGDPCIIITSDRRTQYHLDYDFYDKHAEMLARFGYQYSLCAKLCDAGCGDTFVEIFWQEPLAPDCQPRFRAFREIHPHLERALQISRRLEERAAYKAAIWDFMGYSPHGVIALGPDQEIIHANKEARRILDQADGIEERKGRLALRSRSASRKLCDLTSHGTEKNGDGDPAASLSMVIRRPSSRLPFVLMVMPKQLPAATLGCNAPVAFLFLRDLDRQLDISIAAFSKAYQLTRAETRLVKQFATGLSLGEYAASAGLSEDTVRWHMKNVLAKTNCSSQVQLLNLIRKSSLPTLRHGSSQEPSRSPAP